MAGITNGNDNASCPACGRYNAMLTTANGNAAVCRDCGYIPIAPPAEAECSRCGTLNLATAATCAECHAAFANRELARV